MLFRSEEHTRTLQRVEKQLGGLGAKVWRIDKPLTSFDPGDARMVITVGGDGTLLAASHQVVDIPILGVNSSPSTSVGFFCGGSSDEKLEDLLKLAWDGALPSVKLTRMRVTVNGRVRSRRILNEVLFCHAIPAATSRYILGIVDDGAPNDDEHGPSSGAHVPTLEEEQRSSGVWVGTAAGSTAAIRSAGGKVLPFSSKRLQVVVREPYVGLGQPYELNRVIVPEKRRVQIRNKMDDACLFIDGPYERIRVALGDVIQLEASEQPLMVLGLNPRRTTVDVDEILDQR